MHKLFTEKVMASLIFLFPACGVVVNAFLFFRMFKSWNISASRGLKNLISFLLFLNICNIIAHVAMVVSKRRVWMALATTFSFQTIYFFAAVELASTLGSFLERRLNSFLNIATLFFISGGLSKVFGRTYELCGAISCFSYNSEQSLSPEVGGILLTSSLVHFLVPSSVLLFGSFYKGFHFWERRKAVDANITFSRRLGRLLTNTSSALFILNGTLVVEVTLYFTEVNQATPSSMHMCRVNCLYEELFLLLSMFPVSLFAKSLKQNEGTRDILS